tara:strand:- start:21420 stop:21683 length:264 start_codon:yes stop_codon:yes gene_type:complete
MKSEINSVVQTLTNKQNLTSVMFSMFLSVFGGKAAPNLPAPISALFDNQYFNMVIIALIAYGANSDINMSILASIIFFNLITHLNTL